MLLDLLKLVVGSLTVVRVWQMFGKVAAPLICRHDVNHITIGQMEMAMFLK